MTSRGLRAGFIQRLENVIALCASPVSLEVFPAYSRYLEWITYHFAGNLKLLRVALHSRYNVIHHDLRHTIDKVERPAARLLLTLDTFVYVFH